MYCLRCASIQPCLYLWRPGNFDFVAAILQFILIESVLTLFFVQEPVGIFIGYDIPSPGTWAALVTWSVVHGLCYVSLCFCQS